MRVEEQAFTIAVSKFMFHREGPWILNGFEIQAGLFWNIHFP